MTFDEIVEQVYVLTNRPDLENETKSAVRSAILQMHGIDFFFRDIMISQVIFPEALYIQAFDTSQFQRYRNTAVVRKWDPTLNPQELNPLLQPRQSSADLVIFTPISPEDIFDHEYTSLLRTNVYYAAGSVLYMRSPTAFKSILIGFYQFPDVFQETNFETWLMQNHPYAVIYAATSIIFQTTGENDSSRKYDDPNNGLIKQEKDQIRMANTVAMGY